MGRYLVLWEADESKIPLDPEERKAGWLMAIEGVRQSFKDGLAKDWGTFLGQTKGFSISEGTEQEVINDTMKYIPFFRFNVIPLASIDQTEAAIKTIT